MGESLLFAFWLPLVPWLSLLLLALLPVALGRAADRERRLEVGRWLELHHQTAGDPGSQVES